MIQLNFEAKFLKKEYVISPNNNNNNNNIISKYK